MKYRGYQASVEFDAEDRIFHGRVAGTNGLTRLRFAARAREVFSAQPLPG